MERGIGWSVDMAGLSVVTAPFQVPARVFIKSKDLCASELATGLAEDCPCAKAHTLSMTIKTRRSNFKIRPLRVHTQTNAGKFRILARASVEFFLLDGNVTWIAAGLALDRGANQTFGRHFVGFLVCHSLHVNYCLVINDSDNTT